MRRGHGLRVGPADDVRRADVRRWATTSTTTRVDHSPSYLWSSRPGRTASALIPFLRPVLEGGAAGTPNETLSRAIEIRDGHVVNTGDPGVPGSQRGGAVRRSSVAERAADVGHGGGGAGDRPGDARGLHRRATPPAPRMIAAPGSRSQSATLCWKLTPELALRDRHGVHGAGAEHPERRGAGRPPARRAAAISGSSPAGGRYVVAHDLAEGTVRRRERAGTPSRVEGRSGPPTNSVVRGRVVHRAEQQVVAVGQRERGAPPAQPG